MTPAYRSYSVYSLLVLFSLLTMTMTFSGVAAENQPAETGKMNNERLNLLIRKIDKNVNGKPGFWRFSVEDTIVTVVTDERADRMRIIIPIVEAKELDEKMMFRLLQANFDSALDARYSIAKGLLWSAYIHPLSPLDDRTFLSAIGQSVNLLKTYGSNFSSGALIFKGGDSEGLQRRKLIDDLIKKGMAI